MRAEFQKLRPSEFVHPYKLPFVEQNDNFLTY